MTHRALEGLRVLDLSRILAGPFCTMQLGDLGAEIIKIEQPGLGDGTRHWGPPWAGSGDDRESAYFLGVNRNKRSIALDLKHPKGLEILRSLIAKSDVLVENFKVGQTSKLGIDYEHVRAIHPGIVYCSITGYGQTGPYSERAGYDFVIQAQGGLMSITGPSEGPPSKVGVAIVDIVAGLYATNAILAALQYQKQTGKGQHIDISLLDTQIAWLANVASNYLVSNEQPLRYGNAHPNIVPYEIFETADSFLALGVGSDQQFKRLCVVMQHAELAEDARYRTNAKRVENRKVLIPILQNIFRSQPTESWLKLLIESGIPCGPLNTIPEVLSDPQAISRNMILQMTHPTIGEFKMIGSPMKLSETPPEIRNVPPTLGQHSQEILSQVLGHSQEAIDQLYENGVI